MDCPTNLRSTPPSYILFLCVCFFGLFAFFVIFWIVSATKGKSVGCDPSHSGIFALF